MKNIVKIILLTLGAIVKIILLTLVPFVNFFLFIVSTTEIIENAPTFFFPFLIFETIFICAFLFSTSYSGYTENPPLNFFFSYSWHLIMSIYFF